MTFVREVLSLFMKEERMAKKPFHSAGGCRLSKVGFDAGEITKAMIFLSFFSKNIVPGLFRILGRWNFITREFDLICSFSIFLRALILDTSFPVTSASRRGNYFPRLTSGCCSLQLVVSV